MRNLPDDNDWAADYILDYLENGQRYRTIWSGFSREDAIREFQGAYPDGADFPHMYRGHTYDLVNRRIAPGVYRVAFKAREIKP